MKPVFLFIGLLCHYASSAQTTNCDNWLKINNIISGVSIGKLSIEGDQMTIEATFNATGAMTRVLVSNHRGPNDVNYMLCPDVAQITTSKGFYSISTPCDFEKNKTYHVAMVYDGNSLKIYRNGFLMGETKAKGKLACCNYFPATIGERAYSLYASARYETNVFEGYINEVKIWNVARTQQEIRNYMNTPLPNPKEQRGLMAYYTFDDLENKQGNEAFDGLLSGDAVIKATNPNCRFSTDSCSTDVIGEFNSIINCDEATFAISKQRNIKSYKWLYGDGSEANKKIGEHTYKQDGDYTVVLEAIGFDGQTKRFSKKISIHCKTPDASAKAIALNPGGWLKLDSYRDAATVGDLDVNGSKLTVEALINRTAIWDPADDYHFGGDIVSKHSGAPDCNYLLRPHYAAIATSDGFFETELKCPDIELNHTYHVAMVYDGAMLKFYRDGNLVSEVKATGELVTNERSTKIGNRAFGTLGPETPFEGYINEVRIWETARTAAEIKANMGSSLATPENQKGLLGYYIFEDLSNRAGDVAFKVKLQGKADNNKTNPNSKLQPGACGNP